MDKRPNIDEALKQVRSTFEDANVPGAALDARVLISGILGLSSADFIIQEKRILSSQDWQRIQDGVERRLAGEPVYRILGERFFYGLPFLLSPGTLEPRQDTETLVDMVLDAQGDEERPCRILDLGTGTGIIVLSLLELLPNATGVGVDISEDAVATARKNAEKLGLDGRFEAKVSDWFENVDGRFDVIVSNPPYIESREIETLSAEVQQFDPRVALDGGPDGLSAYRIIAEHAADYLADEGLLAVEIGWRQKRDVSWVFDVCGYKLQGAAKDLAGNDRALLFSRW